MKAVVRKTTNYGLIERLDEKIFGEEREGEASPASTWFLAYVDGKIAGFAGLSPFTEGGQPYGFLERAGILPAYRGHGIQRALITARDREARRLRLLMCFTYTANWNHASSNNLIKCGYTLYEPHDKYGIKGALYWRKKL